MRRLLADPAVDISTHSTVVPGRCIAIPFRARAVRAAVVVYSAYVHRRAGLRVANRPLLAPILAHGELHGRLFLRGVDL